MFPGVVIGSTRPMPFYSHILTEVRLLDNACGIYSTHPCFRAVPLRKECREKNLCRNRQIVYYMFGQYDQTEKALQF